MLKSESSGEELLFHETNILLLVCVWCILTLKVEQTSLHAAFSSGFVFLPGGAFFKIQPVILCFYFA